MQFSLFFAKSMRKISLIQKGFFLPVNFTISRKIGSLSAKIPLIRNIGWNNIFSYEPWMEQLLLRILTERNKVFIDVGANIGQTLLKIKSISPETPYYGFELNPACLFYMKELIRKNKFINSNVVPIGLSDSQGIKELHFFSENADDATASVMNNIRPEAKIFSTDLVFLARLDDLEGISNQNISIIKIDVEGSELEVLQGSVLTIKRNRPFIIVEILPAYNDKNLWRISRQEQLERLMHTLNYSIIQIKKDERNNLLSFDFINKIGINTNIMDRDYILVPSEKISIFNRS